MTSDPRERLKETRSRFADSFVPFSQEATERSIADRFEQIVSAFGDRTAIKTGIGILTYAALNMAANLVAWTLLGCDGDAEQPVALLFDHDAPMIVAMLGVLKAGHFYVPVDPSFPRSRATHILDDSQAAVLLTNNINLARARELAGDRLRVLNIDDIGSDVSTDNPARTIAADSFAYIIYTSGSTGKPKGVLQSHRNVLHDVMQYSNTLGITAMDRMTLLYSYSVNGAVRGIFGALCNGAALYPVDVRRDGLAALAQVMTQEQITLYHSVPTLFRAFAATLTAKDHFPSLRVIRFGGERVLMRDVDLYRKYFPDTCVLYTGMGATETGQVCELFIDKQTTLAGTVVPTGYPVDGKTVVLLDGNGDEVDGGVGEIAVKSRYLSPGYWRKPELTAAVFRGDAANEGQRIYKTGDVGRIRPDGCVEHLGRKDFQTKARGYRVEVAETEIALLDVPGIREAVVLVRHDAPGDDQLVAYIVVDHQPSPSANELRAFLRDRIPDYMVPSAFITLEAMPLTPNGKLDRLALPRPGRTRSESSAFVAPQDAMELRLAGMWERVLGVHPVGATDNFFDLGGHSLRAVELIDHIGKEFGKRLVPAILFQAPTIRQLAAIIGAQAEPPAWSSLVPIQTGGTRRPFFWVHGDSSNLFLPRHLGADQPLYGLEHQSQDGTPARYLDVETIAAHYLAEVRAVQPEGPYCLGGYSFGGTVAFEMAQQLRRLGQEVPVLFILDSHFPGDGADDSRDGSAAPPMKLPQSSHPASGRRGLAATLAHVLGSAYGSITAPVHRTYKKAVCRLSLAIGRPIPPALRSFYIVELYNRARRSYVPRPYPGGAIYIKCSQRSDLYLQQWRSLMQDGLTPVEIPGDHHDMCGESAVRVWAQQLNTWLTRRQLPAA